MRMGPSDGPQSPLGIQELLDLCIDRISDSTSMRSLLACSLVDHRWRESAQLHLFSSVRPTYTRFRNLTDAGSKKLISALTRNPSLLPFVRELDLLMDQPARHRDCANGD
ncbi:hypothetical protein R3P38DRAFT_499872 [Favolaschia claudopus]|uniref:F-box domain-containing protein n=1 Tax=Favolaschia claudopus TaxID=2862362 RepID=A0AAV9ZD10_9AGAR